MIKKIIVPGHKSFQRLSGKILIGKRAEGICSACNCICTACSCNCVCWKSNPESHLDAPDLVAPW